MSLASRTTVEPRRRSAPRGARFEPVFDYEQVRPVYLATGMVRVKFGPPQAHLDTNASGAPASSVRSGRPGAPGMVFYGGAMLCRQGGALRKCYVHPC